MEFDIVCIVSGSQTDGRMAAFKEREPPQSGPPLHAHRNQTEVFHVISGRFLFHCDGKQTELGAGDSIVVPVGAAHTFKNVGSETGVLHFDLLPAGRSEEFFRRLVSEFPTISDVGAFFSDYDIELLGPPL